MRNHVIFALARHFLFALSCSLGLSVLPAAHGQNAREKDPPASFKPELSPLRIDLAGEEAQSKVVEFTVSEKTFDAAGENESWTPQLPAQLESITGDGRRVSLGMAGQAGALIQLRRSRPRIERDKPGRLTIQIDEPRRLRATVGAGAFAGTLRIDAIFPNLNDGEKPIPIVMSLPIELVIPGRRLVRFSLADQVSSKSVAPADSLRVGMHPTVEVEIETVNAEPGSGWIELDWTPEGAHQADRLLRAPVPALETPWDPLESRPGWTCHVSWLHDPLVALPARAMDVRTIGLPDVLVQRHRYSLDPPALFLPGHCEARLSWDQDLDNAPGSVALPIHSGLAASSRVAMVNEPVTVTAVVSRLDAPDVDRWPDKLPAEATCAGCPAVPIELRRSPQRSSAVLYTGFFVPRREGDYRCALISASSRPFQTLPGSVPVVVPFQKRSSIQPGVPLLVFTDSPPFWWDFTHNAEEGARHRLRRTGVLELWNLSESYSDTALALDGIYHMSRRYQDRGALQDRLDVVHDVAVSVVPHGERGGSTVRANAAIADGKQVATSWPVKRKHGVKLDLLADISGPGATTRPLTRGVRLLALRWRVDTVDPSGRPLSRIFHQSVLVRVASEWDYYARWAWIPAVLAVMTVVWLGIYRAGVRIPKRANRQGQALGTGAMSGMGGGDGYFDGPIAPRAWDAPMPGTPPSPKPEQAAENSEATTPPTARPTGGTSYFDEPAPGPAAAQGESEGYLG